MADERISVDKANHVATLTLNRPEKHYALTVWLYRNLASAWMSCNDEEIRAMIIIGAGNPLRG